MMLASETRRLFGQLTIRLVAAQGMIIGGHALVSKLESRLDAHAEHEGELQQLRADFEAQRHACVDAEQNAVVLKAQKEILEARVAELKGTASTQTRIRTDRIDDAHGGTASGRTPRTGSRRARSAKGADTPPGQNPAHPSEDAASVSEELDDPRQARLC